MPALPRVATILLLLAFAGAARAASVASVDIVGLDEEMEENVRTSLSLVDAIGNDVTWRRLAYMLRAAGDETREALEPFGYYSPRIVVERVRDGERRVVLFGDSHALQYGPTMIRLAREKGWRLVGLIRQGCVIAQVKLDEVCDKWRRNTMRRIIQREKPGLVVISSATTARYKVTRKGRKLSREDSQPHLIHGMKKTLQRLRNSGAKVVVIRDQVRAPFVPADCLRKKGTAKPSRCAFRPSPRGHHAFDAKAGRAVNRVKVIDPLPKLCPKRGKKRKCPVVRDNVLVYRDSYHFSATYARKLSNWLDRKLPTQAAEATQS